MAGSSKGFFSGIKNMLGPQFDTDDDDEYVEEETEKSYKRNESSVSRRDRDADRRGTQEAAYTPAYTPGQRQTPKTRATAFTPPVQTGMGKLHVTTTMDCMLTKPKDLEEAVASVEYLVEGKVVVLNLEETELAMARRVLDFVSGAAMAINGDVTSIAAKAYMITPANINLIDSPTEILESNEIEY